MLRDVFGSVISDQTREPYQRPLDRLGVRWSIIRLLVVGLWFALGLLGFLVIVILIGLVAR